MPGLDMQSKIGLQSLKQHLLRGGVWVASGFAVNAFAGLFVAMLLTRILPLNEVGTYFLVLSLVTTASGIVQFGMSRSAVRFVAEALANGQLARVRPIVTYMLFIIASAAVFILLFSSTDLASNMAMLVFGRSQVSSYLLWIGFLTAIMALRIFVAEVHRGLHNIKMAALTQRILPNLFVLAGLLVMWFSKESSSLSDVLILLMTAVGLVLFVSGGYLVHVLARFPTGEAITRSEVLKASFPLFISDLFQLAMIQAPFWILGATSTQSEIASFGTAVRAAGITSIPLLIANNVMMPVIAGLYAKKDEARLARLLQVSVTIVALAATLIMLFFVVQGESILRVLFGQDYVVAYLPLILLSLGRLFNVYAGSATVLLAMSGNEGHVLKSIWVAAVIGVATSFALIPALGAVGAALAATTSLVAYNVFLCWHCKMLLGIATYLTPRAIVETLSMIFQKKHS